MRALARGAGPLLGALAIAVFAAGGPPGDGRAEGLYLARLAVGVLAAASFTAPRPSFGALASVLVTAAAWILPAGPPRGTVVVALLAGALAVAAFERLRRVPEAEAAGSLGAIAVPCAIGLQMLLRSDLLLGPVTWRLALTLFLLPVVAGTAVGVLARRGAARAAIAGMSLLALGPGWNATTVATLVGLAIADRLGRARGRGERLALGLVALLPLAVSWRAGLLLALAAAALFFADRRRPVWTMVPAAAGLALGSLLTLTPPGDPATAWLVLPLLPMAALAVLLGDVGAIAGALLAVTGGLLLGGASALAPGVALATLAVRARAAASPVVAWQARWTATLLLLTTLAAAYPWLRADPLRAALASFGLGPPGLRLALPLVVIAAAAATAARPRLRSACGWLAVLAAAAALVGPAIGARTPLLASEAVLSATEPARTLEVAPESAARVLVVDTALLDGAALAAGTEVAAIAVTHADGMVDDLRVRAGDDTGDWAARRADLRAATAPHWLTWVAATEPPLFGQRYRAHLALRSTAPVRSVVVRRAATLPAATRVVLYAAELVQ